MNNSLAEVHPELISECRRRIYRLHPMTLLSVQIKKYGGKVIAAINDLVTLEPLLVKQWSKKNEINTNKI